MRAHHLLLLQFPIPWGLCCHQRQPLGFRLYHDAVAATASAAAATAAILAHWSPLLIGGAAVASADAPCSGSTTAVAADATVAAAAGGDEGAALSMIAHERLQKLSTVGICRLGETREERLQAAVREQLCAIYRMQHHPIFNLIVRAQTLPP
ncbi:hypothetical protein VOLCADRAFT_87897 [Volvox carteri f. nagariensis]|uniref:Uncharacterized protein n=1 Tax=Volvox carteri f. nagariensis TaxID=3068 RepID=D8TMJ0_VOLCA|nr:uncharacterized protein VOLCADRAFT_87897 [Volvox carteri f. nagariensis]EFJ51131.1 hypothetical protein VOLCADRAFT_87897 [Volvox carteri f. nagariensis]|eukprot:XP_002947598.1 hypothetical protein VOLCADRAFT_87897 [Volvox carteri f. nagariensis]